LVARAFLFGKKTRLAKAAEAQLRRLFLFSTACSRVRQLVPEKGASKMQLARDSSAHSVNKLLDRKGPVWEEEFFDRLLRKRDWAKIVDYICRNPVVAGLAHREEDYPWLWLEVET
jgi:hypothetical protein